jgi:hypothetical protein
MKNRFDEIRKFVNDDFGDIFGRHVVSYSVKGQFVDLDKYDIVPKANYIDQEIRRVDQELETLERQQESTNKYYENRKSVLLEEKEKYKRQKSKSG